MSQFDAQTKKQLGLLKIITWAFMFVGPVAYLIIAHLLSSKGVEARAGNEVLLYLFLVVSLANVLVAAPIIVRMEIQKYRAGAYQGRSPVQFFVTLSIIQMALVEAIYIYGLIAFVITGKFTYMLYFYPIGIASSFVYWPKREKYERLVERLNKP